MTIIKDFFVALLIYAVVRYSIMEECRHTRPNLSLLIIAMVCAVLLSGLSLASDSPAIQRTTQQVGVAAGNETSPSSFVPTPFNTTSDPASASASSSFRDSASPLPFLILLAAATFFLTAFSIIRMKKIKIGKEFEGKGFTS